MLFLRGDSYDEVPNEGLNVINGRNAQNGNGKIH